MKKYTKFMKVYRIINIVLFKIFLLLIYEKEKDKEKKFSTRINILNQIANIKFL